MQKKASIIQCLIIGTTSLLLPALYIHYTANTINPFYLNEKQFLPFFGLLTATSFVTGLVWVLLLQRQQVSNSRAAINHQLLQPKYCVGLVLVIGLARLGQGISNHKPVGYLVLLLLLNFGLYKLIKSIK